MRRRSGPRPIQDSSPGGRFDAGGRQRPAGGGKPRGDPATAPAHGMRATALRPGRRRPGACRAFAGARGGKGLSLRSPCGPRRPSQPPCDRSHGAVRPRRNRRAAKRPPRRSEPETPDGAGESGPRIRGRDSARQRDRRRRGTRCRLRPALQLREWRHGRTERASCCGRGPRRRSSRPSITLRRRTLSVSSESIPTAVSRCASSFLSCAANIILISRC